VKSEGGKANTGFILKKLLISSPIWALIAALIVKILELTIPETVVNIYEILTRFVSPVILIAIGLKFNPVFKQFKLIAIGWMKFLENINLLYFLSRI
jgi:predicted permease